MPPRNPLHGALAATALVMFLGLAPAAWSAPADDLRDAQKLYQQGKMQPALDKVEVYLKSNPRDPQGRFLKGLVLTEQKRIPDAIAVFTGLTEDFPELPEPYNNLAVLYASQGNYDKAKAALELAIHTHPSYATAHENLGDIYAQLASRAYDRALQLDKTNTTAQVKLAMIKDLFSSQKIAAASAAPTKTAAAPASTPPAPAPAPAPAPTKVEPAKTPPPVAETKATPPPPAPPAATTPPAPTAVTGAAADRKAQIVASVESWAHDWSAKDLQGYLSHYAVDFEVPNGASRAAWEKERGERIEKPKSIEVTVKIVDVKSTESEATVTFKQTYKSDTLKNTTTKTLKLQHAGDRWLIKQERVGG